MKDKLFGMLGLAVNAGSVIFGTELCLRCLKQGKAKLVIVALDTSPRTKEEFIYRCNAKGVPYIEYGLKADIGHAVGKPPKTVVAVTNQHFADAIVKINGGGIHVDTKN